MRRRSQAGSQLPGFAGSAQNEDAVGHGGR
jgi:hypothetical protein